MSTAIELKHVSYRYQDDGPEVLQDVNLRIRKGEWVTILGPNGSGKSTLAKMFNALLVPDAGEIVSLGYDTRDDQHWPALRRRVGMVFQNPDNQLVAPTVRDDVAFGLENAGVPQDEMRRRVAERIAEFGLSGLENHEPHRLSGGQKQRVAIAGVMALAPDVIVFDEATSMIDPEGSREVWSAMAKLRESRSMTLISITHDVDEAVLADRVIIMKNGRMFADGPPREILRDTARLKEARLLPPFAGTVADKLTARGLELTEHILTEEELITALWTYKQNS
ncbi:energy-coupling factor transporter ATPase [Salisediminibacterium beveridgei]|uniref:ATPase component of general energizing module of ECF transporter, Ecf ATPase 1 n=1 Tax=Salisediminibacterium beveridgei TaxID=632773 RepID=A0A1D7QZV7_9BACI|nr:energy-coupling factor transporter ATPase [Salisediminibacterium beveridgei]AOM84532.1 ATPase component of general energizing module of ECF transporter, Ecf ATPase 1 [Salisediminibacterium beveridgei]